MLGYFLTPNPDGSSLLLSESLRFMNQIIICDYLASPNNDIENMLLRLGRSRFSDVKVPAVSDVSAKMHEIFNSSTVEDFPSYYSAVLHALQGVEGLINKSKSIQESPTFKDFESLWSRIKELEPLFNHLKSEDALKIYEEYGKSAVNTVKTRSPFAFIFNLYYNDLAHHAQDVPCLLYTSPSPRD